VLKLFVGFDHREDEAYRACVKTLQKVSPLLSHTALVEDRLRDAGLLWRPVDRRGMLYDLPSNAPCSTEFANSRFLTPILAQGGWALFVDCDVIFLADPCEMLDEVDKSKAVWVVKHMPQKGNGTKMDGQAQQAYPRKNWSSVMLFNCDHPANHRLTVELINTLPGRDLHRFFWLNDDEIGELPPEYNYLVGHTENVEEPAIVHFTDGTPSMPGYEDCAYADEWRRELTWWAQGVLSFGS
jgi:hypothetical protein